MFEPKMDELVAVMARDVAVRTTHEGRAIDLALAALRVLGECGTITGGDLCDIATAVGFDRSALATAWKTRASFESDARAKALDAPLARVLPLR